MMEDLIVMLIVGAAAWHAGARYLPAKWRGRKARAKAGCASGCDTCSGCAAPVAAPTGRRVITIHSASQ